MRILLFGKQGQVGWELQSSLAPLGELIALDRSNTELHADFAQPEELRQTVQNIKPDVIVNAAAYTAVDKAEDEPELAYAINATAPGVLAEEAAKLNAVLVHFSTDYVFNGSGVAPWLETDIPAPLNVYGKTKLASEHLVQQKVPNHLIFRTSWVYGVHGNNFAKTMLRLAQERDTLDVVNDQFGAPTGARLLADVAAHAIKKIQQDTTVAGLYHVAAGGQTTWYNYAKLVLEYARAQGWPLRVAANAIHAVPSQAFVTPALRPMNSRLDTHKLQARFGLALPPWQEGVLHMLQEIITPKQEKGKCDGNT